MGCVHFFIFTLIAISSAFVAPALAKEFIVGDESGWTLNFDYQSWAMGKEFHKLATSLQGYHNVFRVDGVGFKQCSTTASLGANLSSGNIITPTPGRKWYVCGVGRHCVDGKMKLVITVLPPTGSYFPLPAPAPAPALEKEFIVGDEAGWTLDFDYQRWAMGKEFHVGDKLIFKYKQGNHNVYKVDGLGFRQCSTAASLGSALTSGNDVISLTTPGRKWYICGVGRHCADGNMKLLITVLPPSGAYSPAPAPYYSGGSKYGSP
ncbi:hypothetical protein Leryth_018302 [Lithospermum erythrorhizon]|nr:hypothetical protein Leryth_018302 [Lithospermum erythrorhizon]